MLANDQVSFAVAEGEIHALLGENGAGKSTLVKIIYGVLHADEGSVLWHGEPVRVADPHAARGLGIGMVFQHFSLFEAMTVLENIALGVDDASDMRRLARRIEEVSHAYGLPLDPAREVHTLSVGERQRIEIVRCLLAEPQAPDHGRADLGADAAGGRARCSRRCASSPPRAARSSTFLTSCARSRRCATAPRSCAAARSWRPATPRPRPPRAWRS